MMLLKRCAFVVNVTPNTGGGSIAQRFSVNECIVEGINHARFLLRPDALAGSPSRTHATVRVEVLCATCRGDGVIVGRRGKKPCSDCRGGKVTSPISGTTAIEFIVYAEGGAATAAHPGLLVYDR